MSAPTKEHVLPPGKLAELRRLFDLSARSASAATDPQPLPTELGLAFGLARAPRQPEQQRQRAGTTVVTSSASVAASSSSPLSSLLPVPPHLRAGDRDTPAPSKPTLVPANGHTGRGVGGGHIAPRMSGAGSASAACAGRVPSAASSSESGVNGRSSAVGSLHTARVARAWENEAISRRGLVSTVVRQVALPLHHPDHASAAGSPCTGEGRHGGTSLGRGGCSAADGGDLALASGPAAAEAAAAAAQSGPPFERAATVVPSTGCGGGATARADDRRHGPAKEAVPRLADHKSGCAVEAASSQTCAAKLEAAEAAVYGCPHADDAGAVCVAGTGRSSPDSGNCCGRFVDDVSDCSCTGDEDEHSNDVAAIWLAVVESAAANVSCSRQPQIGGVGSMALAEERSPRPPKPPRTFEHDIYVQSKVGRLLAAAPPPEAAAVAASSPRRFHHYEEIDVDQLKTVPATSPETAAAAELGDSGAPVYETLRPMSPPFASSRRGRSLEAVGAATAGKPPLPTRPPPKLDLPAVPCVGAGSGGAEAGGRGAAKGSKGALLKGMRWRHEPEQRRKKNSMKRYASAECITAAGAVVVAGSKGALAEQQPPSPQGVSGSSLSCATLDGACSAGQVFRFPEPVYYASSMLIPAQTLTRSSSYGDLSTDASASSQHRLSRDMLPGLDSSQSEPAAAASIPTARPPTSKKRSSRRDKVTTKLHSAFSQLGQAGRRIRSASIDEGSALASAMASEDSGDVLQRRLQHCSTVKERSVYASPSKIREYIYNTYRQLFSYAVVVGLQWVPESPVDADTDASKRMSSDTDASKSRVPCVTYKFPAQVDVESLSVPLFCFPDVDSWKDRNMQHVETYSFVLTGSDGSRLYGYCKRYTLTHVIDGQQTAKPEVICITSPLSAATFFSEILDEFVHRRKASPQRAEEFLEAAYGKLLPRPGGSISIRAMVSLAAHPWICRYGGQDDSEQSEMVTFARPVDSRVEDASCSCLLQALSARQIVSIFAAILNERKVVLCAEKPSTLSPCVGAFVSLLYPFSWQHTLVPVLPPALVDVVCSPTPFVVGVLTSCLQRLGDLDTDEVLIVNLDTQKVISAVGDEHSILPKKLFKALQSALDMSKSESKYQDTMISEAFLYFFFESLGSLDDYIFVSEDGQRDFQKDKFVRAAENSASADFVKWFSQTQMFDAYLVEKCEGYSSSKAGDYEDRFISWLHDPVQTSSERTPMKGLFRNLFYKAKGKK